MTNPEQEPVKIEGVYKKFGSVEALRGLSITIHRGEIFGVLGPNGAGKSTLIRSIVGLIKPDQGQVVVLGEAMPNKPILSRLGYMTQASALYDDLTVWQNVAFFAGLMGCKDDTKIQAALDLVELAHRADSPIRTLSGGMRQRVSLASVMAHQPEIILLDEPTVGVDPQLRAQFWAHFRRLTEQGITIIVSSHVMDEAERCDRLGFIRGGQLLAEGSADALRQQAGKPNLEDAFLWFAQQKEMAQ
ncbi:MAG: ABC transporter ATP-binding protein [Chloroflexota bacterium]|nr:ABC transporter ATP-binding protein [Chloroflexota bacterium]NOG63962.1 ABC transporter ATP-binding protein [Chloroflexota bacterium]GIK65734.1 MAG: ABC transporter ATP-binding protein [Chloroflexota bacterium]